MWGFTAQEVCANTMPLFWPNGRPLLLDLFVCFCVPTCAGLVNLKTQGGLPGICGQRGMFTVVSGLVQEAVVECALLPVRLPTKASSDDMRLFRHCNRLPDLGGKSLSVQLQGNTHGHCHSTETSLTCDLPAVAVLD